MNHIIKLCLLATILTSCVESFKKLDAEKFNTEISNQEDTKSPEELIQLFYNYPKDEGAPKFKISTKNLGQDKIEITLIHDHLEDNSQSGVNML